MFFDKSIVKIEVTSIDIDLNNPLNEYEINEPYLEALNYTEHPLEYTLYLAHYDHINDIIYSEHNGYQDVRMNFSYKRSSSHPSIPFLFSENLFTFSLLWFRNYY
jgi:hypothetical protein